MLPTIDKALLASIRWCFYRTHFEVITVDKNNGVIQTTKISFDAHCEMMNINYRIN